MGNIGEAIKIFRQRKKFTQETLSEKTGVDRSLISKIEKGRTSGSIQTIKKLAAGLGVSISEVIEGRSESKGGLL